MFFPFKRSFDWQPIKQGLVITAIIAVVFFFLIDGLCSKAHPHTGQVVDKEYHPPYTYVTVSSTGGKYPSSHLVVHHVPAHYYLMVYGTEDGSQTLSLTCGSYGRITVGATVHYNSYHGYYTGWRWSNNLIVTEDW